MVRVAFVLLLSTVALAQETPTGDLLLASRSADTELQAANAASGVAATPNVADRPVGEPGLSSAVAPALSSSKQPVLQASNAIPREPLILSSSTTLHPAPSVQQKRVWWMLAMTQHGAATFDAWSTRSSIESGNGYERNPLMKPFAKSAAIYPVIQVLPLGLDYVSKRMMRSRHGLLRKTWWVPQTIATAGFVWSGARNMRIANLR